MASAPVGTRLMVLLINGHEYQSEVSAVRISQHAAEETPLTLPPEGNVEYVLKATAVQDIQDVSSLWRAAWDNPNSHAEVSVHPYGAERSWAGYTSPYLTGTVRLQPVDGDLLGGDAKVAISGKFTFDIEWPFLDRPVLAEE